MLLFLSILITVLFKNVVESSSYQSSLMKGGHPILRTGVPLNIDENDIRNGFQDLMDKMQSTPSSQLWLLTLRGRIRELVRKYGFEGSRPYIQDLVDQMEKEHDVDLHVRVKGTGDTTIRYLTGLQQGRLALYLSKYLRQHFESSPSSVLLQSIRKRSPLKEYTQPTVLDSLINVASPEKPKHLQKDEPDSAEEQSVFRKSSSIKNKHKKFEPNIDETDSFEEPWLNEFKDYVKGLVMRYGRNELMNRLKPVVNVLQVEKNVRINDIDVNQFGEVFVKLTRDMTVAKKNQNEEKFQVRRSNWPPDEPGWLTDLRRYIMYLHTNTKDRINLSIHLEPIIEKLEFKYKKKIHIKDFNIDGTANIRVTEKTGPTPIKVEVLRHRRMANVKEAEHANNVEIKDIDVSPKGEINMKILRKKGLLGRRNDYEATRIIQTN